MKGIGNAYGKKAQIQNAKSKPSPGLSIMVSGINICQMQQLLLILQRLLEKYKSKIDSGVGSISRAQSTQWPVAGGRGPSRPMLQRRGTTARQE